MAESIKKLNGHLYAELLCSGANAIYNQKDLVDQLNVFPVPDGDTGSNMSMTVRPASTFAPFNGPISDCAVKLAGLFLRNARGNSGVILSLFFRGISKGLSGADEVDTNSFMEAFRLGVKEAYKAVQVPKEGTILTVMRVCSEIDPVDDNFLDLFSNLYKTSKVILAKTPDLLPVLKQAGVVDSGGRGFSEILLGMLSCLRGNPVKSSETQSAKEMKADFSSFDTESITNPYCTECIITKRQDLTETEVDAMRQFVMNAGDSVVFADDEEIIKLHVHTKDPGKVLSEALKYGSLYTVKVENMKNQHTELINQEAGEPQKSGKDPEDTYGFVAIVMGDGIKAVFEDFGVTSFVHGGQTMNPSTEQLIEAVENTPAKNVFLLPNNGNVCLVAEQVAGLVLDRNVIVIPSVSVPEGISAMMNFDPELSIDDNRNQMLTSLKNVSTLEMTYAVHNSNVNGEKVTKGQLLGLVNHKIKYVADTREECMGKLASAMTGCSYITVFYGSDISDEEAENTLVSLKKAIPDAEIALVSGGQPLYYYIISAE